MKARVVKAYQSDYTEPWYMVVGERLQIGERDSDWEGWVWCTNSDGQSRWVPENFIEPHGDSCTALRDYESTELNVQIGEVLKMGETESGWTWCTKVDGQSGWVPLACLKEDEDRQSTAL